MDMTMSIASASMMLSASRMMTDVNMALMGRMLDMAEVQGRAMQEMMESMPPPDAHILDVYA